MCTFQIIRNGWGGRLKVWREEGRGGGGEQEAKLSLRPMTEGESTCTRAETTMMSSNHNPYFTQTPSPIGPENEYVTLRQRSPVRTAAHAEFARVLSGNKTRAKKQTTSANFTDRRVL